MNFFVAFHFSVTFFINISRFFRQKQLIFVNIRPFPIDYDYCIYAKQNSASHQKFIDYNAAFL